MGVAERRERQKIELREAILDAAERIIAREGFTLLTMRRLADEIEYSAAALYQYYSGRDDIAKALVRRGFQRLIEALTPSAQIQDPADRLAMLGHAYIAFGLSQPVTYRLIFMESPEFSEAAFPLGHKTPEDPSSQAFELLASTVVELQACGKIRTDVDADTVAHLVWSAIHGITSLKIICPQFPAMEANDLGSSMFTTILRGLAVPAS